MAKSEQPNDESVTAVAKPEKAEESAPTPEEEKYEEISKSNSNNGNNEEELVSYLSKCCTAPSSGGATTDVRLLLQDFDPSSLVFLKELATSSSKVAAPSTPSVNNNDVLAVANPTANSKGETPPLQRRVKKEKKKIRPKLLPTSDNDNEQDRNNNKEEGAEKERTTSISTELGFGDYATPKSPSTPKLKILVSPTAASSQLSTDDNQQ